MSAIRSLTFVLFVALAVLSAAGRGARAGDGTGDPKTDAQRTKLLEVLLDEGKLDVRVKGVSELAALDSAPAAKVLLECLGKLAARTAQVETRAAKTRADYEPYKGGAQSGDRNWEIKKRLLEQMEKDDGILRGDTAVLDAFTAAIASLKNREALAFLDRGAAKEESLLARSVLYEGLLKNPTTRAADLAKRAMADPEPSVRLAALQAFLERKDPALADLAVKALADARWPIRLAAIRALQVCGDLKSVAPLVAAMANEEGSVLDDYAATLAKLTGAALGPNADAWKRWVEDHRAELVAQGASAAPPKATRPPTAPVDYYGIQTRSLRILFLIDCSGSMNEVIGSVGVTTGEQMQGKKIDIAKRVLRRAIVALAPGTMFDVITFSTDARRFNDKLVPATDFNKHAMGERVDELVGRGGTYTYGALKLAFGLADPNVTPSAPPVDTIFVLSDGAPTDATFEENVEATAMDPEKILSSVRQWNHFKAVKIHTIAIDPRIEKTGQTFVRFMKALAEQNGGTYTGLGEK